MLRESFERGERDGRRECTPYETRLRSPSFELRVRCRMRGKHDVSVRAGQMNGGSAQEDHGPHRAALFGPGHAADEDEKNEKMMQLLFRSLRDCGLFLDEAFLISVDLPHSATRASADTTVLW